MDSVLPPTDDNEMNVTIAIIIIALEIIVI